MNKTYKEYHYPFVLEATKLTSIVQTAHAGLGSGSQITDHFEVLFSGSQRKEFSALEEVLALDNSAREKIHGVVCDSASADAQIQIDFDSYSLDKSHQGRKAIAVRIEGRDASWRNRVLADIEAQIERTKVYNRIAMVCGVAIAAVLLLVGLLQIASLEAPDLRNTMWLDRKGLNRVSEMVKPDQILKEDQIREVTTMQLRNLVAFVNPGYSTSQVVLVFVAVVVVAVLVVLLIVLGYPRGVYLWGDEKGRQDFRVFFRRTIWTIIFAIVLSGACSRFIYNVFESRARSQPSQSP